MSHPQLSILIPAAGESRRLGQAKQLLRFRSGTLIQNAVNIADSITPRQIIVVTGASAKALEDTVQQTTVRWVHNPHWSDGMGGSIAAGMTAVSPESSSVMIFLCDQWRLQTSDLQALTSAWRTSPGRIVCSQAGGQYMPPVIFPSCCFEELRSLSGESGARNIIKKHPELLTPLNLQNAAFDLDTPAHLDNLKSTNL